MPCLCLQCPQSGPPPPPFLRKSHVAHQSLHVSLSVDRWRISQKLGQRRIPPWVTLGDVVCCWWYHDVSIWITIQQSASYDLCRNLWFHWGWQELQPPLADDYTRGGKLSCMSVNADREASRIRDFCKIYVNRDATWHFSKYHRHTHTSLLMPPTRLLLVPALKTRSSNKYKHPGNLLTSGPVRRTIKTDEDLASGEDVLSTKQARINGYKGNKWLYMRI